MGNSHGKGTAFGKRPALSGYSGYQGGVPTSWDCFSLTCYLFLSQLQSSNQQAYRVPILSAHLTCPPPGVTFVSLGSSAHFLDVSGPRHLVEIFLFNPERNPRGRSYIPIFRWSRWGSLRTWCWDPYTRTCAVLPMAPGPRGSECVKQKQHVSCRLSIILESDSLMGRKTFPDP